MADKKQEFEDIRGKGFVSLLQSYVQPDESTQETVILNDSNYQGYVDSLEDGQLNQHGLPPYNLMFYQIEESEGVCSFYPSDITSSPDNQVSPLEWPQFTSCVRISQNRFLITGGVNLNQGYSSSFLKKFKLLQRKNELTASCKKYIEILKRKPAAGEEDESQERKVEIHPILNAALELSKKEEDKQWQTERDPSKRDELLVKLFEKKIDFISDKTGLEQIKVDKAYCKENNITYTPNDDTTEKDDIFNKSSPYVFNNIELSFQFVPEDNAYQFTGRYLNPLPKARSNHQTVYHKGKVYILGGVSNQKVLSSVLVYDVLADTWSEEFPDLLNSRVNFTAVSHGDHIYVFGGHSTSFVENSFDNSTLERINPEQSGAVWEKLTLRKKLNLKFISKQQIQLISHENQLLLLGGYTTQKELEKTAQVQVSKIDIDADKWSLSTLEGELLNLRKDGVVARGTYKAQDCFFALGGTNNILLECFKLNNEDGKLRLEKVLDNDYTAEINSYNPDFIAANPTLYIE